MEIRFLKDVPEAIAPLAEAYNAEWPKTSVEASAEQFKQFAQGDQIPLVLVALHDNKVCGAVGLLSRSVHSRPQLGPWVAALYVWPEHRRKGLGAQLIRAAESRAQQLSVVTLYAGTSTAVSLFSRLGWVAVEALEESGEHLTIMKKSVAI